MKKSTCFGYTYDKKWEEIFPVTAVKADKHAYYCVPCGRKISCAYNGLHGLKSHCKTSRHRQNVSEDKSKTNCTDSVCNGTLQSDFNTSIYESIPSELSATNTSATYNQPRSLAFQNGVNCNVAENQRERLETSNTQNKELVETTLDGDSNMMEMLEKCKSMYGVEFNVELDKDFNIGVGQNFKLVVTGIYQELLFLQSVLKKLQNLKK
ncbi:hypothetical protein RF11_13071 [Thelohanellus kitauei]|uniref:Uncharacterized protein n=1 Tax=Thelohanellus kitauei TaxID=669202 RepID=A0A0C2N0E5_THEKT|nr:hypothetical protein RF11_13071 [Thelohanellus kitauei]